MEDISLTAIASSTYFTYGLRIIGAFLIFFIGKSVAGWLTSLFTKLIKKSVDDETIVSFLSSALYIILLLFVIFAALSQLGIQTTSFVAMLSAIGLAIGLALRDTFSSVGAGILIVFFKPFKIGDTVEVGGVYGTVESMNIFSSVLKTTDNKIIIVPNSKIISNNIVNESAKKVRRLDMILSIGYDDDLKKIKEILSDIVENNVYVLKNPVSTVAVFELAENSVRLIVRAWVKTSDYTNARYSLNEEIKLRFDKEGIKHTRPSCIEIVSNLPK